MWWLALPMLKLHCGQILRVSWITDKYTQEWKQSYFTCMRSEVFMVAKMIMFSEIDHLHAYRESQPRRTLSRLPTNNCESLKASVTLKSIVHKTYFSIHFMFFTPGFHNKRIIDRNANYFLHALLFQFIRLAYISWEVSLQQGKKHMK
jgi:hypothetical protein